ncbi:AAA family ATPase [Algoriphagus aquimarinus]|uniref:KGGVGR-motif variant AAA ATPase n=1 Tax=Algoriphagus aquimarinus TaxID=237018 RepID=UPI0030DA1EF9|tara:strand:+ start:14113 stop:15726 length:1614 start_codon:yes stop_codon:yes gene_type:complete
MKTITFYSYKGGVGRSLALVNIATRLAEFGKKVCVIDFDLEAPGLHLKFPVSKNLFKTVKGGIVDLVYDFSNNGVLNKNIQDYTIDINITKSANPLILIPAGNTDSLDYWKKLASINWYELIYENPNGLAFFLHLKEIIKNEIKPDFLLIDSRTGISEMSGISLSLLAEEIVLLAANNKENLGGIAKIIKSINNPENNFLDKVPALTFVLSRIPFTEKPEDRAKETFLLNRIKRDYLYPYVKEINVIHSDRELEEFEKVKIAYEKDETSTQISIDYLKLFEKLTKDDLSENEIKRFKNIRESERLMLLANNTEVVSQKLEFVNRAIDLNKKNIELYPYRANLFIKLKDFSNAMSDVNKSLKLYENHIPSINLKTHIFIFENKFNEAEELSEFYLKLKPNDINALLNKVIIYTKSKKYQKAESISDEIIKIDPEFSIGYSCRGNSRRLLKNMNGALEDIFKSLELDSENLQGIATLAEIYGELGHINEFYIHLENALRLDTNYIGRIIHEEDVYSNFFSEERFLTLLAKYGIYLDTQD